MKKFNALGLAILLLFQIMLMGAGQVAADDSSETALILDLTNTTTGWVCSPDCGSEPVDETDWYRFYAYEYQTIQIFVENLYDYSQVELQVTLFDDGVNNQLAQFSIGSNDNESELLEIEQTGYYLLKISAIDGWGDDGSSYSITTVVETDNAVMGATPIQVGTYLPVGYVCISDCPDGIIDPEDWYSFDVKAGQQIGILAEELTWFSYLDFELYVEDSSGNVVLHDYEYHGGSSGGLQDYSVRAWFNASIDQTVYIRVYTDQSDDVLYNLSVSEGEWIDVVENDYHWISFPEFQFGDTLRVQAIRTDSPNDLDILLFNSSEFHKYRDEVVNNATESPEELMVREDCLVCSFSFSLTNELAGLTDARPSRSHSSSQQISWSPSIYFVADYTDYRSNPPMNGEEDVASVFLSVVKLESQQVSEDYELLIQNEAGEWNSVSTGTSSNSMISPPAQGWSFDSTESNGDKHFSKYRLIVTNSNTGAVNSDSIFEIYNHAPESCMTFSGDLDGEFVEGLPISFDASCSNDIDNDELTYTWKYMSQESSGVMYQLSVPVGTHSIELEVVDSIGAVSTTEFEFTVHPFPIDGYSGFDLIEHIGNASNVASSTTVLYQNTTVAPSWTEWEIIGSQVGIGIVMESRVTQVSSFVIDSNNEGDDFRTSETSIGATESSTETAVKMSLALIIRDIETGNETVYDMPMPTSHAMYDNQDWIVMPSLTELYQTIYLWNELAVVDQSSTTPGLDSEVQFDIEIPTIDLIQYIELIIQQFPGSQVPLLAIGLAIDYNLYIDIDLEVNMETSGEPRLFRNPENDETLGVHISEAAPDLYTDYDGEVTFYPYLILQNDIEIEGSIGLRLRIAQPAWLTFGLGFMVDDPMFLEGIWQAELVGSDGPLGTSSGLGYSLSDNFTTFEFNAQAYPTSLTANFQTDDTLVIQWLVEGVLIPAHVFRITIEGSDGSIQSVQVDNTELTYLHQFDSSDDGISFTFTVEVCTFFGGSCSSNVASTTVIVQIEQEIPDDEDDSNQTQTDDENPANQNETDDTVENNSSSSQDDESNTEDNEEIEPMMIIIGSVVVFVILVAGLTVLLKKKKHN